MINEECYETVEYSRTPLPVVKPERQKIDSGLEVRQKQSLEGV